MRILVILAKLKMTYEVSIEIDAKVGIDGDDFRYGMDEYVDQTNANTSTEKNTGQRDDVLN
jgi:hypothetical protein